MRTCEIPGCERVHKGRGLCNMHLMRLRKTGEIGEANPIRKTKNDQREKCKADGCEELEKAQGYCTLHYDRFRRQGTPELVRNIYDDICSIPDCDRPHNTRGYCWMHWQRIKNHGDPYFKWTTPKIYDDICTVDDCDKPHFSGGYCSMHYRRVHEHGDPNYTPPEPICNAEGCENRRKNYGYCQQHLNLSERHKEVRSHSQKTRKARKRTTSLVKLTRKEAREILEFFNHECAYCGSTDRITQDHVLALNNGGTHTKNNIVTACRNCNPQKHTKLLEEWYPSQPFFTEERYRKILEWTGYKILGDYIQPTLF